MADAVPPRKILLCGDVGGSLNALYKRFETARAPHHGACADRAAAQCVAAAAWPRVWRRSLRARRAAAALTLNAAACAALAHRLSADALRARRR